MPRNKSDTTKRQVTEKTSKTAANQILKMIEKLRAGSISATEVERLIARQIAREMSVRPIPLPIVRDITRGIIKLP